MITIDCYYSEHAEEEIKKVLSPKPEPVYPPTPEKFQLQASPMKRPEHLNNCPVSAVPSPQHNHATFQETNEKSQEEISAFNTVQHHPTYHNNNQSWPIQPGYQPSHPHLHHHHPHHYPQPPYPPMTSFGYHNGQPTEYQETHFTHNGPNVNGHHANASGYNQFHNNQ